MSADPPISRTADSSDGDPQRELVVRFDSEAEFRKEFSENLAVGALFVPTSDPPPLGQRVEVRLALAFCDAEVRVDGEVVGIVETPMAELGATHPGVSIRIEEPRQALKRRLARATGLDLRSVSQPGRPQRRGAERKHTGADIVITSDAGEWSGRTANLSYAGVLALVPMKTIAVGTEVQVHLSTPAVELELSVGGKIIHVQRCDGGQNAHGIQLRYPAERIDEVMAFIEFLQSFDRARRLATVAGEINDSGLGATLEMFVRTAPAGTLVFERDDENGKVVFSEDFILHCSVGMVAGIKALARLVRWSSGRFEFHHEIQLPDNPDDPQPFEAAMMMASVQVDELARIGFDTFRPTDTFEPREPAMGLDRETLTELEREVLDYAIDGFNVGAIADMVAAPDAEIMKALAVLGDVGVLARRR